MNKTSRVSRVIYDSILNTDFINITFNKNKFLLCQISRNDSPPKSQT